MHTQMKVCSEVLLGFFYLTLSSIGPVVQVDPMKIGNLVHEIIRLMPDSNVRPLKHKVRYKYSNFEYLPASLRHS